MKKETLADKLAKKTFHSEQFQKSWMVHMGAFGPILEPAFAEDYQSRIHLTAALNQISRRDIPGALKKLEQLRDRCEHNADKAAWLFFMGLCFEFGGMQEQMLACYQSAGEFHPRFYMRYMKLAKFFQQGCLYERAEENFRAAIGCFQGTGLSEGDRRILGSAYTSLATCLTMMHRYEEAERNLETSRQLWPEAPGRSAAEAVLYAALGQWEKTEASLSVLKDHAPEAYPSVRDLTERIRRGTEALFCPIDVEAEKLTAFWQWFESIRAELEAHLDAEEFDGLLDPIEQRLNDLFPFGERELEAEILLEEGSFRLLLPDYYAVGLTRGYERLLEKRPELDRWQFEILHILE